MPDEEATAAKQLLASCMQRGVDSLNRSTAATPREAAELYARSSEQEQLVLGALYRRTMGVLVGSAVLGVVATLRVTRRPLLSSMAGAAISLACTSSDAAKRMPSALLEVARVPEPSGIADEVVCPAVLEFERAQAPLARTIAHSLAACQAIVPHASLARRLFSLQPVRRTRAAGPY